MITKSIYFRLTVWYTVACGLVISALGIFLYGNFRQTVYRDHNKFLNAKAQDLRGIIVNSAAEAKIAKESEAELFGEITYAVNNNLSNTFLRVSRPDGAEIAHSIDMPPAMITMIMPRAPAALHDSYFSNGTINEKGAQVEFRFFTLPVIENGKVQYIIQVCELLKPIVMHLTRLRTALFLLLPLSIMLIAIAGLLLTKAALQSVDNMTKTIRQITSKNLQQRIMLHGVNDEISRLGDTFNDMLERLDKAFASQQQLIEDISHELRTPLTALRGKQEVALLKKRLTQEYEAVLNVNLEEIDKMSRLVENLLVLARMEKKQPFMQVGPVDLNSLINSVIDNMRILAGQKDITIEFLPCAIPAVEVDARQISQVFSNIIDNAIKYTEHKGRIRVALTAEGPFAKIGISDTGSGISEEDIPFIFDRFYRADKSRSSPGFGLGLSIAKSIVDAHNGRIEVESSIHSGTTFFIFLPLAFPHQWRPSA